MTETTVDEHMERLNYLNKRLKEFNKPKPEVVSTGNPSPEPFSGNPNKDAAQGWI